MPNMSNRLLGSGLMKTKSKIRSFKDVKKALQDLEKVVNELSESLNKESETEVTDTDGKTGDTQATRNADGTYNFEIKTIDGWKTPVIGKSAIKFTDKPASISKPYLKNISDIETEDTSTGASDAEKTIFDEKDGKFKVDHLTGIPRPDYESDWVPANQDTSVDFVHNLNILSVPSMIHYYISDNSSPVVGTHFICSNYGIFNQDWGIIVGVKDKDTITLHIGDDYGLFNGGDNDFGNDGAIPANFTSGYAKVKIWK